MDDLVAKVEAIEDKQEAPKQEASTPDVDSFKFNPDFMRLSEYFKIDPQESNWYQEKLITVLEWAKEKSGSKDIIDALVELKSLERELGTSADLTKRINTVYRWVRLDQDERRIQKEKGLVKK